MSSKCNRLLHSHDIPSLAEDEPDGRILPVLMVRVLDVALRSEDTVQLEMWKDILAMEGLSHSSFSRETCNFCMVGPVCPMTLLFLKIRIKSETPCVFVTPLISESAVFPARSEYVSISRGCREIAY